MTERMTSDECAEYSERTSSCKYFYRCLNRTKIGKCTRCIRNGTGKEDNLLIKINSYYGYVDISPEMKSIDPPNND